MDAGARNRDGRLLHAPVHQWRVDVTRERLRVACVLDDDGLASAEPPGPVCFSPLLEMRGGGNGSTYIARVGSLLGLSLTFATARLGATPVSWRAGDVRSPGDRHSWPISWATQSPLLERASRGKHPPLRIHKEPDVVRVRGGYLVDDQLIPSNDDRSYGPAGPERTAGSLRIRPCGPIISVR